MDEFFEEYSRSGPKTLSASKFWTQDFADNLFELFYDSGFQDLIHQNRSKLYLHENIAYFMRKKNFERIKHLSKLNIEDLLRIMIKTSGISSFSPIKGITLCDTGGQRTERKKWNKIISNHGSNIVECLVVSLAEFDEVCYEDDVTNRYEESLTCFREEFVNTKDLTILFTKYEVLKRKVSDGVRFSDYVSEFSGNDSNVEEVRDFIIGKYVELDTEKKIRKFIVVNSAFDHLELQQVFNEITETNSFDSYFDEYLKKLDLEKQTGGDVGEGIHENIEKWTARPLLEDEILQISNFLELDDLLNMNQVCKMWNHVTYRASLILRRPNLDLFINSGYEFVKSLTLQSRFVQKRHIEALTQPKFAQLEYLDLRNNYLLRQEDFDKLFGKTDFKHLKTLLLDYVALQDLKFLQNSAYLRLHVLSLNGVKGISTEQVIQLIKSPSCQELKEVNTKNCPNTNTEILKKELKVP
ncbi:predicted protein [Naegleria gruberi]|uniref:Predicted protein n=1 Tax=Naegleria gruberi TaxID=5762 RepID=D2VHI5_NAEGR|nr:uncharacterized protein NAEGRDRAFT_49587 [Naegleria gruberi]EFC43592.1 predicted protein [Naegleria gruberi]|eukprot:XP_002676336.1 predicted protein [Naegleria gruberi strain NEG-M]